MPTYNYTLRLTTDAEPGTGLGGELVNDLIPRDHDRKPVIPASHVKGLMRAALRDMADALGWPEELETRVFGGGALPEDESGVGTEAIFQMASARANTNGRSLLVTRTAIDAKTGGAKKGALRTTEAIAVGTVFQGRIDTSVTADSAEDLAWRLALLSVGAIGGGRNRGCGQCITEIQGETRTAGILVRLLGDLLQKPSWKDDRISHRIRRRSSVERQARPTGKATVVRLDFHAMTPICCPEIPDKTNVIATGFSIPASAVQGAILTRLGETDPVLATALLASPVFRAWPLLPCQLLADATTHNSGDLPVPIRVSLTHRAAKFSLGDQYGKEHFVDDAIQPDYDWRTVPDGAPLKASDGVLLHKADGQVALWRAASMPHTVTAHGVHGRGPDDRHLFTVDAMAPMVWRGMLVLPELVVDQLLGALRANPVISIGKSRSVRGMGKMHASVVEGIPDQWQSRTDRTVLVVQSPLLLPDTSRDGQTAEQELSELATAWAQQHNLQASISKTWANIGIRFGWNRHKAGRQQACRVVLPGSVIAFSEKLDDAALARALVAGIGLDGRQRGYGAVSTHPGTATELYRLHPKLRVADADAPAGFRNAVELILDMRAKAQRLPSPSQIRAVQQRLDKSGKDVAIDYLKNQTLRTTRIWFTWESIHEQMTELLEQHQADVASRALTMLINLAIVDQRGGTH